MNSPQFARRIAGMAAAAILFTCADSALAQTLLYSATTLPAPVQTGSVHYMQLITLSQGAGVYSITNFSIGVNFAKGTANQGVEVFFWNNVDTSTTSADALGNATMANPNGLSGTLAANGPGNQTYFNFPVGTANMSAPYLLTLTGSAVGVEILLTDATFDSYSSDASGRFSAATPTVGSSASYVWNDADLDNTFAGSEQTNFGQTGAYMRFDLSGSLVPEPGTWALVAGSTGVLALVLRRRMV